MSHMKAVWYERQGAARDVLTIGEMAIPAPGPGEVQVRVMASGINPVDVKTRAGTRGPMPFPRQIPHFDGAGIIEAVGRGVRKDRVGERVWLHSAAYKRPMGTAAQYCAVPTGYALPLPETTSFAEGACLGVPALTAHRAVHVGGPIRGQTILVTGGAGAVGGYAIQFAKDGGAHVISTISSAEKAGLARSFGADHTINYKTENVVERIMELTRGAGVDRVVEVEFGGNIHTNLAILKMNGSIAAYASMAAPEPKIPYYGLQMRGINMHLVFVFGMPAEPLRRASRDVSRLLQAGKLHHYVPHRYPLADAVRAHEAVENAATGNVVLEIAS
ncbi:MAG: NADPH:quinone reductase [Alphaproteobacteria bacterium]